MKYKKNRIIWIITLILVVISSYIIINFINESRKVPATCPSIVSYKNKYDGNWHTISVGESLDGKVLYKTSIDEKWTDKIPERSRIGKTEVYVKVKGDSKHKDTECGTSTIEITYEADDFSFSGNIYIVGDSIAADYERDENISARELYGWGTMLEKYFDNVNVIDLAVSGESSRSFIKHKNYQKLVDELGAGDYLLIAFGNNDEDPNPTNTDSKTEHTYTPMNGADYMNHKVDNNGLDTITNKYSFEWFILKKYVELAKEKGAQPIILTPITRIGIYECSNENEMTKIFCPLGKPNIIHHIMYSQTLIDIGNYNAVPVINLTCKTYNLYNELYQNDKIDEIIKMQSKKLPNPELTDNVDEQHFSKTGANVISQIISEEIEKLNLKISNSVIKQDNNYDNYSSSNSCLYQRV